MSTRKDSRCAIYTRKSTEEGLDQAFNSLDAQRDACVAYIRSQVGEGWKLHPPHYDDGGFSGGNMERPALVRLLQDIDDGRIDCVVVYKIDRLTRSLADFAKIVERFERRNVTFVSVTQSFNTTTSMGRLTLNVLLSFSQFEREVSAERIRDKFAASKAKGIFMGGNPPLGYDARDRKLVINEAEAETVRMIFERYVELRSVGALVEELEAKSIRTKSWTSGTGRKIGGGRWFVGALRYLLRNRVYVGLTLHKGKAHPGQHKPIIDKALFERVQSILDENAKQHSRRRTIESSALLTGLIFDDRGNCMTPQWSLGRGGVRHAYYVSQALLQRRRKEAGSLPRVPATMIEDLVLRCLGPAEEVPHNRNQINSETVNDTDRLALSIDIRARVRKLVVSATNTDISIEPQSVIADCSNLPAGSKVTDTEHGLDVSIPGKLKRRGGDQRIENWTKQDWGRQIVGLDSPLAQALVRAHRWFEVLQSGSAQDIETLASKSGVDRRRFRETIRLAMLAPDIQRAILEGRHPPSLTLERIVQIGPPLSWNEQRRRLGLSG